MKKGQNTSLDERLRLEQELLSKVDKSRLYNILIGENARSGSLNPFFGRSHSLEARKQMSVVKMNRPSNFSGHTHSEETKEKLRRIQSGKKYISRSLVHPHTGSHCVYVDGTFYASVSAAHRATGLSRTTIRLWANDSTNMRCVWVEG